jgi:enamine deaminase RidA (YjgF/YER057c/UK114 family)
MARQLISSGSPYEPTIGFSRAVRDGNLVAVSGTAPVWPDGHVDVDPLVQARRCWEIALAALAEAGGRPEHVIRTRQYLVDRAYEPAAAQAHGEVFADIRPASTMVIVSGLLDPRWLLEFELDAVLPDGATDPTGHVAGP